MGESTLWNLGWKISQVCSYDARWLGNQGCFNILRGLCSAVIIFFIGGPLRIIELWAAKIEGPWGGGGKHFGPKQDIPCVILIFIELLKSTKVNIS